MCVSDWMLKYNTSEWVNEADFHHSVLDEFELNYSVHPVWCIELKGNSEKELWEHLHYKSCKYCINKAKKFGLEVRVIDSFDEISEFVDLHYDQICNVSRRHKDPVRDYQSKDKLMALCSHLFPNNVLMLEVVGKDETEEEQKMASAIFCLSKKESVFWTSASYEKYLQYCPNELMVWEALRIIKERGGEYVNLGGMNPYKRKFGSIITYIPRISVKKNKYVISFYDMSSLRAYLKKIYAQVKRIVS